MSARSIAPVVMAVAAPAIAYLGFSDKLTQLFATSTDNAVVRREVMEVKAPVAGQITYLAAEDGDDVGPGAKLLVIEQRQAVIDVAGANQTERSIKDRLTATTVSALQSRHRIKALRLAASHCETSVTMLEAQADRSNQLLRKGFATKTSYDQAVSELEQRRADCLKTGADADDEARQLAETNANAKAAMVQYYSSTTASRKGQDQSQRGTITAPFPSKVGNRRVSIGSMVQVGNPLLTLISNNKIWIEANFREDQLGRLGVGSAVKVRADALKGHVFTGYVKAVGGATVGTYAAAAVRTNAGSFTKLAQWVPLRIELKSDPLLVRLPAGASCEVWL